jgi:bifunctional non-homologous end joining protein LigD
MLSPQFDTPADLGTPVLGFVKPQLPTLVEAPPVGDGWLHEIKHDGNRTLVLIEDGRVRAFTRNGHDWTDKYRRVVACAATLRCRSAILDGESVVQDERGLSDFPALRRAMHQEPHRLAFFAFDLLHLDGADLRSLPLIQRKASLATLLGPADPDCAIQFCEAVSGDGSRIFAAAERMGLEGIVSKKATSKYRSGPSTAWLKTKCMTEGEFVVIGTEHQPGQAAFALLARKEDDGLRYAGSAFVTLAEPERDRFWSRAAELATDKTPIAGLRSKATWCRPALRVRARHLRGGEMLRHASLTALIE